MMTNPKTSYGYDHNEIYLIGDTTVPGTPATPCVRVPPQHADSFAEIMADYIRRRENPATLERAFNITKPYELLSAEEVREFIAQHSLRPKPYPNPKPLFQKATDLFRLTDVYFNRNRTLALTAISTWCNNLCGTSNWKIFEKTNSGNWEERPWITCSAIASSSPKRGIPILVEEARRVWRVVSARKAKDLTAHLDK